mmetsp:Transcript_70141/g.106086  ORF Transcript_70141/g.106086 Transcript_70141/m.106086 type:complete len:103 (+) Transcript_70141:1-309(+)
MLDVAGKKPKRLKLDVAPTDKVTDVKKRVLAEFETMFETLGKTNYKHFGLFILKAPAVLENYQLRYLTKEERLKEVHSIEEAGVDGKEDIVLAHLTFYEGVS